MLAYLQVIRRLQPDRYLKNLGFAPAWFASIRPRDPLPRWQPVKRAFDNNAVEVGPFPRRADCQAYITQLEDLFDLCREHRILDRTPNGEACTYFDMGRCPAPCDGTIPLGQYQKQIDESVRFATAPSDARLRTLRTRMNAAAADRNYAAAARLKESIDRVRSLFNHAPTGAATVERFRFLIIQRGEKPSLVKPFFVTGGDIAVGEATPVKTACRVTEQWIARLQSDRCRARDPARASENVWLVTHFLAKGAKAPGLFIHFRDAATADKIARRVEEAFARRRKSQSDNAAVAESTIDPTP
jgi:excinuclease UvrABC nuclease subunit